MSIEKNELKKLAKLASLKFTEAELDKYTNELI